MGRPPKPAEQVRRNRLTITLTDAEIEKLEELAEGQRVPVAKVAHEILERALRRRK